MTIPAPRPRISFRIAQTSTLEKEMSNPGWRRLESFPGRSHPFHAERELEASPRPLGEPDESNVGAARRRDGARREMLVVAFDAGAEAASDPAVCVCLIWW